jgi:hypothetical protein
LRCVRWRTRVDRLVGADVEAICVVAELPSPIAPKFVV